MGPHGIARLPNSRTNEKARLQKVACERALSLGGYTMGSTIQTTAPFLNLLRLTLASAIVELAWSPQTWTGSDFSSMVSSRSDLFSLSIASHRRRKTCGRQTSLGSPALTIADERGRGGTDPGETQTLIEKEG